MKVEEHLHVFFFFLDVMLDWVYDRVVEFVGTGPVTVWVETDELCSRIAVNNTVDVDHGDNLEDEVVKEVFGGLILRYKKVNNAL